MRCTFITVVLGLLAFAPIAEATHIRFGDRALPGRVTCGGGPGSGFYLYTLRGPAFEERRSDPAAQALRDWIEEERRSPAGFATRGFRTVRRTADKVLYVGGHGQRMTEVLVERFDDGHWAQTEYGGCEHLAPAHPTAVAATWDLDPAQPRPSASTRRLRVLVHEESCAGFASARGRIRRPRVFVDGRRMVVTLFIKPIRGNVTCPGTPPTPYVVRLPRALGARALMDGGRVPARTILRRP